MLQSKLGDHLAMSDPYESTPGESFPFIDCSDPGNLKAVATRRLIHQHSMKDVGKSRRRPKKKPGSVLLDISPLQSSSTNTNEEQTSKVIPRSSWWLGTAGVDPFLEFPIKLDSSARELVAIVFKDDGGLQRPLRDAWFTVGLADQDAFLQVLSNSALHLDTLRNGGRIPRQSPLSIYYQQQVVRSISKRLGKSKPSVSDGLIGAVSGLICHDDIIGDFSHWTVHHKGLRDMIEIRGGIEEFENNETLRVTLSWIELRGAFAQDLKPYFPTPRQWLSHATPPSYLSPGNGVGELSHIWFKEFPGRLEWINIYEILVSFSLSSFPGSIPRDGSSTLNNPHTGAWTNPTIHRLLTFRPLEQYGLSNASLVQEACRLGSLLYLVPVWRTFGVFPVFSSPIVQKLKLVMISYVLDWSSLWKLQIWVLYMGAMEAEREIDRGWFVGEIADVLRLHDIHDWSQGFDFVKEILWADTIFGARDIVNSMLEEIL